MYFPDSREEPNLFFVNFSNENRWYFSKSRGEGIGGERGKDKKIGGVFPSPPMHATGENMNIKYPECRICTQKI